MDLKKTSSDIIAFLDSDDYYDEKHLQIGIDYFCSNNDVDFITTKTIVIGDRFVIDARDKNKLIDIDDCTPQGTFFLKRKVIQKLSGFPDADYESDYLFYNLAKQSQIKIHNLNNRTYIYDRTGENSITKNKIKKSKL